jgi:hypothetical protein
VNLSTVATQATLAAVKTDTDTIAAATDVALSTRAADSSVQATNTSLGTDGAGESPANGTGVRGWLRSIYDRLTAGLGRTWTLSSGTDSVTVAGTTTITGTVNQGTGGSSAWKVDGSAVTQPVSGPLTDTQLRATAVPVSNTNLDVALSTRTKPSDQQHAIVDSSALPTGAATDSTVAGLLTNTQLRASPVPVSNANLDVALSTRAADTTVAATNTSLGTDGAGESPANGTGVRGWLRSIYDRLTSGIGRTWTLSSGTDSVTASISGTVPVSGTVTANQGTGGSSAWKVDGSATTQPVSAASLPLPTGAATEATLALVKTDVDHLDVNLSTVATQATLALIKAKTDNIDVALSTRTKPSDQQHVIVDSSALPTGAATDTTVAGVTTSLGTDGAGETPANGTGVRGWLRSIYDKLASSIAVTGTFWQATQPVSVASLPLPAGASTAANQATEIANLQAINSLTPSVYDYISLSYTGSDLTTVVFKVGGVSGTVVSTLTLAYTSSVLQSVTKT